VDIHTNYKENNKKVEVEVEQKELEQELDKLELRIRTIRIDSKDLKGVDIEKLQFTLNMVNKLLEEVDGRIVEWHM